ncbi:hypothetical protein N658DRAFT_493881 [Parathielavia hyrcaniae]|uniref:Ribosomal protein S21 n=1 Tax=Parathielavia hyrcaniae TaxID=113614 RepID=A0AAN6T448_9PEZI|nr:hypothetical protein N658DRAFT_493881 [Parathielavia hyrcaniae]
MEFRQVVHCVRRSAAAATRPSLASTQQSPSAILFQHHHFTSNTKPQQQEAAAAQQSSPTPLQARIDQVRTSIPQPQVTMPPRPPPFRQSTFFQEQAGKKTGKNWTAPGNQPPTTTTYTTRNTTLTGRLPTSPSAASAEEDPYSLFTQINTDMERSTTGPGGATPLTTWREDEFVGKYYDVAESALRLRPSTGRTFHVKGNVDVARGLYLLGRAVKMNGIKDDVRLSRRHERPALKRKRQKRERWQARFKQGFRAAFVRVMELRGQGW